MHCPECNKNNKQRKEMKDRYCGCCANTKHISFHRFVQWRFGFVCWLDHNTFKDASVEVMNERCLSIIHSCYKEFDKKINRSFEECKNYNLSPSEVTQFYCSQFLGNDCKIKNNF